VAAKVAGSPSPTHKCVAVIDKYVVGMSGKPEVLEEKAAPVAQCGPSGRTVKSVCLLPLAC
jgi:hypothetical protein